MSTKEPILDERTQGFPSILLYVFFLDHEAATLVTLEELTLMKSDSINEHLSQLAKTGIFDRSYVNEEKKVRVKYTVTSEGRKELAKRLDKSVFDGVLGDRPTFRVDFGRTRELASSLTKQYLPQ